MFETLLTVRVPKLFAAIWIIGCSFVPPATAIFVFDAELFRSLDTIRLLILCAVIGFPFMAVNAMLATYTVESMVRERKPLADEQLSWLAIFASWMMLIPFYLPILVRLLIGMGGPRIYLAIGIALCVAQTTLLGFMAFFYACPESPSQLTDARDVANAEATHAADGREIGA